MSTQRYTSEFQKEAFSLVFERGHAASKVAARNEPLRVLWRLHPLRKWTCEEGNELFPEVIERCVHAILREMKS